MPSALAPTFASNTVSNVKTTFPVILPWLCEAGGEQALSLMNFHDQVRECHSERSEESERRASPILRFAQNDIPDVGCENSLRR